MKHLKTWIQIGAGMDFLAMVLAFSFGKELKTIVFFGLATVILIMFSKEL